MIPKKKKVQDQVHKLQQDPYLKSVALKSSLGEKNPEKLSFEYDDSKHHSFQITGEMNTGIKMFIFNDKRDKMSRVRD